MAALAQDVAQLLRDRQAHLRPSQVRRKGIGDFVTALDLRAERLLRKALTALLPEAGFLGEETAARDLDRPCVWVVDPIDGTSNFAAGLPQHAVAIGLLEHGCPILAVAHCMPEDATYVAVAGHGVRAGRRRLRIPDAPLDDAAIVGCQWLRGQQDLGFVGRLQRQGSRIRTFGSTVTQLADVAAGRLTANVQEQGRIWDFAAAGLFVLEAGGRFTDWQGRPVFPLRDLTVGHVPTVAAGPRAHRAIVRLLGAAEEA